MFLAPICPYCKVETKLADSECIYGRSYGFIYLCEPCKAYCGVHKGTLKPLGTPANKELRALRKEAHSLLDPLWKSGKFKRSRLYKDLAIAVGVDVPLHIGETTKELCERVITVLKERYYI